MEIPKYIRALDHIREIEDNYAGSLIEMGPCSSSDCDESTWGPVFCPECNAESLAKYCGRELADKIHRAIAEKYRLQRWIVHQIHRSEYQDKTDEDK